jgi:ABC-type multidrug transport system ATPase subunit
VGTDGRLTAPFGAVSAGGPAVAVEGVTMSFGKVTALDGIDLEVPPAMVFGLLGPNGAGKTTLVRILATLLRPSGGRVRVLGYDAVGQPLSVRRRIGLAGQFAAVDEELTGRRTSRWSDASTASVRRRHGGVPTRCSSASS